MREVEAHYFSDRAPLASNLRDDLKLRSRNVSFTPKKRKKSDKTSQQMSTCRPRESTEEPVRGGYTETSLREPNTVPNEHVADDVTQRTQLSSLPLQAQQKRGHDLGARDCMTKTIVTQGDSKKVIES